MEIYIASTKNYFPGDIVSEKAFYSDLSIAKEAAQLRAEADGALFGSVYEVSTLVDENTSARIPCKVIRHVDWSI